MFKTKKFLTVLFTLMIFVVPAIAGEIHEAAAKGDLAKVKALLKSDMRLLSAKDKNDKDPLQWACQHGRFEVVKFLVGKGAAINSKNIIAETPLHYASGGKHKEIVEFLLSKGADVNAKTDEGHSPLSYSLLHGKPEISKLLLKNGAETAGKIRFDWTMMHYAARGSSREVIDLLIEKGNPVNARTDNDETPLHIACWGGNAEAAKVLTKAGADVACKNKQGETPLYLAVKDGHPEVTAVLIEAGAKVEKGYLHIAAAKGYGKVAYLLLENGADPNARDESGKTPLDYAARYSHVKVAKILISKGADKKNAPKAKFGFSPLLKKQFKTGDALVWYLGHSGWAVKTPNHFLIFDYFKFGNQPDTPFLDNGSIVPEEIKNLDVTVFVSHAHGDHFFQPIFDWQKDIPNIAYVMGFEPKEKKDGCIYLGARQNKKIKGMDVFTIESNDSGVGFVVKADGVTIFHSGDHANRKQDFSGPFKAEIDYLEEKGLRPDIFFAPVSGCGFSDLEALKKGVYYTMKALSPRTVFPMHGGNDGTRHVKFAEEAFKAGFKTPMCCGVYSGDRFYVGPDKIKGALKPGKSEEKPLLSKNKQGDCKSKAKDKSCKEKKTKTKQK